MPQDKKIYLLSDVQVADIASGDKDMPRKFSGIANSGRSFNHYGQRTIVDLSDISYHDKVPALIEHDRSQRAGFGTLSVKDNQLVIEGTLLDNEYGNTVASDADAGFPWQMSAHVIAGSIEELAEGQTAIVNGHTVTAPTLILRHCKIPEVSFTPTGVDSDTSAVVLSDNLKNHATLSINPNKPKDTDMTLEEALAKIAEQEKTISEKDKRIETLEAENDKLKAEKAKADEEAHEAAVDAQLSQAGFSKSDGKWQGLSDATRNVLLSSDLDTAKGLIADLKPAQTKPNAPDYLFSEQHKPGDNTNKQLSDSPLVADAKARTAINDVGYL